MVVVVVGGEAGGDGDWKEEGVGDMGDGTRRIGEGRRGAAGCIGDGKTEMTGDGGWCGGRWRLEEREMEIEEEGEEEEEDGGGEEGEEGEELSAGVELGDPQLRAERDSKEEDERGSTKPREG